MTHQCPSRPQENSDGAVLGAGHDMRIVESEIQNCGGVVREPADGAVGVGYGVDDARPVRGAGD